MSDEEVLRRLTEIRNNPEELAKYNTREWVMRETLASMRLSDGTIEKLTEEQWKERYVAYMKKHSDIEDWQAEETADAAWLMTVDETPEEAAETELSYLD